MIRESQKWNQSKVFPELPEAISNIETRRLIAISRDKSKTDAERTAALKQAEIGNLRLVAEFVKRSKPTSTVGVDDLFQEGYYGVRKAVAKFNLSLNIRFSTYVVKWIRQYVGRYARTNGIVFRYPEHVYVKARRVLDAKTRLESTHNRTFSTREIARSLGMGNRTASTVDAFFRSRESSIGHINFDAIAITECETPGLSPEIERMIDALPRDQSEAMYFCYSQGLTTLEVAEMLDVHPHTVSIRARRGVNEIRRSLGLVPNGRNRNTHHAVA